MWPVLPDSDIGLTDCLRSNLYLICLRYNFKCKMLYPFDITNSHGRIGEQHWQYCYQDDSKPLRCPLVNVRHPYLSIPVRIIFLYLSDTKGWRWSPGSQDQSRDQTREDHRRFASEKETGSLQRHDGRGGLETNLARPSDIQPRHSHCRSHFCLQSMCHSFYRHFGILSHTGCRVQNNSENMISSIY